MKCPICGSECGTFKICLTCRKRWVNGEILICVDCKKVTERSKYDENLCPDCFVYRERMLEHELPLNPYAKFQTNMRIQKDDLKNESVSPDKMKKYYCDVCKKDISKDVFRYSVNKYKKPLCFMHQRSFVDQKTDDLINLVKERHEKELTKDKNLVSIDDWIKADFNQWKSELNNKEKGSYIIKTNDNENLDKKRKYRKYVMNRDKQERKIRGKIGGGR